MFKKGIITVALLAAFATGASAATGWHTFATATDSGEYGQFANADAKVLNPNALAVRATRKADVTWTLICDGESPTARANAVLAVSVRTAQSCSLSAFATADGSGTTRLQLLRK